MAFDLSSYEPVKARKLRFYKDHPDGRIVVEHVHLDLVYAVFKVAIFLNKEDQEKNLAKATGYALEYRDTEVKKNQYGKTYESVNFSSWTENAEESAVGRALDNAGYASNGKCSREEMEKAQAHKPSVAQTIKKEVVPTQNSESPIGNYTVNFGQNSKSRINGKTLSSIPIKELESSFEWWLKKYQTGEKLGKGAKEFIAMAGEFLNKKIDLSPSEEIDNIPF